MNTYTLRNFYESDLTNPEYLTELVIGHNFGNYVCIQKISRTKNFLKFIIKSNLEIKLNLDPNLIIEFSRFGNLENLKVSLYFISDFSNLQDIIKKAIFYTSIAKPGNMRKILRILYKKLE